MYYFVLKARSGNPQGFLDYDWNFTLAVSEAMCFDTIKECEMWMDESFDDPDLKDITGPDDWRKHFLIQKVFRSNLP